MTPAERHTAVLVGLAELEQLAVDAGGTEAVWTGRGEDEHDPEDWDPQPEPPTSRYGIVRRSDGTVLAYPEGALLRTEARHIAANAPASTLPVLAGRRRILERHTPPDDWEPPETHCLSSAVNMLEINAPRCRCCSGYGDTPTNWPCPDYRDAAADLLPAKPERRASMNPVEQRAADWHSTRKDDPDHGEEYGDCWCCCTSCDPGSADDQVANPYFVEAQMALKVSLA